MNKADVISRVAENSGITKAAAENEQIAKELDLNHSDVQQMTTQLREGIVKKTQSNTL